MILFAVQVMERVEEVWEEGLLAFRLPTLFLQTFPPYISWTFWPEIFYFSRQTLPGFCLFTYG